MPEGKPYPPPPTADGSSAPRDPYAALRFQAFAFCWLSLAMLFLTGVFDSVSVVVRQTS